MKTIFNARVLQKYRNRYDVWYDPKKGHTGVDLDYDYEGFYSPYTGTILQIRVQPEMGQCIYLLDAWNNVHIFGHFARVDYKKGDKVIRGRMLGITGGKKGGKPGWPGDKANAGSATSRPHVHHETIVRGKPYRKEDAVMVRELYGIKGWNTDPIRYGRDMYAAYKVPVV